MNGQFEYHLFDEEDNEHIVDVEYNFIPCRPATYSEPSEGGVEIISVECKTKVLTKEESLKAQEACAEYAYAIDRESREDMYGFV